MVDLSLPAGLRRRPAGGDGRWLHRCARLFAGWFPGLARRRHLAQLEPPGARELLPANLDLALIARVARDATVVADPDVGDFEIRRRGDTWHVCPRLAAELNALRSHA